MFKFSSSNDSKVEKNKNFLKIKTNKKIWDNSIIVPLDYFKIKKNSFLNVKCSVTYGKIGIGVVGKNFSKYLFKEIYMDKRSDKNIQIPVNSKSRNLIFRNVTNISSNYKLYDIQNILESRLINQFSNSKNINYKIENIFKNKDWTSAKNLFDDPILPFIFNFQPNFWFEDSFKVFVTSARSLKNCYFHYKKTPLLIFPFLQKILKKKKPVYWDVGANLGASTVQIAKKFMKNSGKIVAIECEPDNVFSLQKNFQINNLDNSIVLPIALGQKNAINQLNLNDALDLNHKNQKNVSQNLSGLGLHTLKNKKNNNVNIWGKYNKKINILMMTADYLVESKILSMPDYIFIDAALYEQDIINGMKKILKNKKKPTAILVEQTPGGASGDKSKKVKNTLIAKKLTKSGYKMLEIENYSLKKFDKNHVGNYFMTLFYNPQIIDHKIIKKIKFNLN